VGGFFNCFYWPWCSTQICWEDSVLLWVWVERRSVGKLTSFFLGKAAAIIVSLWKVLFSFPHETYCENRTEYFLFFLILHTSSVPNFCKSFAFGTILCKNVIALADVFPISCQWKEFLYSILFLDTLWSVIPTKCHAVVPYRKRLNCWLINQHWARWWGLGGTKRQAGELLSGPGRDAEAKLMTCNRTQSCEALKPRAIYLSCSLPNHQYLQSDACNIDGSLCVNTAAAICYSFVPARLFLKMRCWCSGWWFQKNL